MLARGRDDIEKAVEEGNDHEEYSCILKPGPKTEAHAQQKTTVLMSSSYQSFSYDIATERYLLDEILAGQI